MSNADLPTLRYDGEYVAQAVTFDGTNDYLTRGATLTGAADSTMFTISFWMRPAEDAGQHTAIQAATSVGGATWCFVADRNTTSKHFEVNARNAAGTNILVIESEAQMAFGEWTHCLASMDLADIGKRHIYLNDVSDLTVTTYTNDPIDFTVADWAIGVYADGTATLSGEIADLWFQPGLYIDGDGNVNLL